MCCRYYMEYSPELLPIIEEMNRSALVPAFQQKGLVPACGEIRPTMAAPVVASNRKGQRAVFPMRWGFREKTLLINARSETAAQKPTFREAWQGHRCAIPASWYYEWEHRVSPEGKKSTGDRYLLRPKEKQRAWLCGLYRMEDGLPCYVVLTREAGEEIRFIHDRMPLILPDRMIREWIRPGANPEELAEAAVTDLYCERA